MPPVILFTYMATKCIDKAVDADLIANKIAIKIAYHSDQYVSFHLVVPH